MSDARRIVGTIPRSDVATEAIASTEITAPPLVDDRPPDGSFVPAATRDPAARPRTAGRFHLGGLDGLRALAIAAVLLYHGGNNWVPGGFLGVDLFFVISGFLITTLILEELRATGTISIRAFLTR